MTGRRARRLLAALLAVAAGLGSALAASGPGEAAPRWGWLGVRIRDLSEVEMEEIARRHGIREGFGAMIVEVMKATPAEVSGLRTGDLVVGFRGRPVVDTRTLQRFVAAAPLDEPVVLTVLRGAEGRRPVSLRLAPMPADVVAERVAVEFGFVMREPAPEGEAAPRVVGAGRPAVTAVLRGGSAEVGGLRAGDVLVEVNARPVLTLEAARAALAEATLERPLALVVSRADGLVPLTLAAPRAP